MQNEITGLFQADANMAFDMGRKYKKLKKKKRDINVSWIRQT
jgi:hypothetical protein